MPGLDQVQGPIKLGKVEPWMAEFVKGRHSQEEWDAFFEYCKASSFKRWCIIVGSVIHSIFFSRRSDQSRG